MDFDLTAFTLAPTTEVFNEKAGFAVDSRLF